MATRIIDIAKAAEVSPSAVSLALNNKSGVSAGLRTKILDIAGNMGYLVRQGSRANTSIKLLKIAKHGHIVNERHNAFITEYLEGIEQGAKRHNYKLEVSFFNRTPVEEIVRAELSAGDNTRAAAGLIILGTELSAHELGAFTALSRPTVFIDTYFPLAVFDCVDMDNGDGVFRSIEYFYRMGHRNIGLVKSSYGTRNFKEREEGFREAMEYFSLPVQEHFIAAVDPAYEQADADMARFLAAPGLRTGGTFPSAFFCMNDIIAYGCIRALRGEGLAVPGDVSVIGFDDLPSSSLTEPPLTSIRVSTRRIGEQALEKLVGRIEGTATGQPEKILVSGTLMIRGSVKKM
jgi:LacI family transcriptional regulator